MAIDKEQRDMNSSERKVVLASSLGTIFEWYDFYLFGALATIISRQFFNSLDPSEAFLTALLTFGAGFVVRPLGALFFGRLGDMIGRKYTFLVTILIMGLSTFIVGLLPNYQSIGVAAPLILIYLRLMQGFAMGGGVWRCRHICCRTCASEQTRRLHGLDTNHSEFGIAVVFGRDWWVSRLGGGG